MISVIIEFYCSQETQVIFNLFQKLLFGSIFLFKLLRDDVNFYYYSKETYFNYQKTVFIEKIRVSEFKRSFNFLHLLNKFKFRSKSKKKVEICVFHKKRHTIFHSVIDSEYFTQITHGEIVFSKKIKTSLEFKKFILNKFSPKIFYTNTCLVFNIIFKKIILNNFFKHVTLFLNFDWFDVKDSQLLGAKRVFLIKIQNLLQIKLFKIFLYFYLKEKYNLSNAFLNLYVLI
nr:hypothetical protein CparaKRNrm3_p039 [Cryptomonas paramecium]